LEAGSVPPSLNFPQLDFVKPSSGFHPVTWEHVNTSLVDLLLSKGIVDSHSLHKVSHSFPKVVPSEKTSIAIKVAIVDNIELAIQVGGHTPRMVLLDIGAQLVILRV